MCTRSRVSRVWYNRVQVCVQVFRVIVSCFFSLTNLEYLRVGSFSFSGVVGDPTQAGKNKTHVTFSHGKKHKSSIGSWAYSSYLSRVCLDDLKNEILKTCQHAPLTAQIAIPRDHVFRLFDAFRELLFFIRWVGFGTCLIERTLSMLTHRSIERSESKKKKIKRTIERRRKQ